MTSIDIDGIEVGEIANELIEWHGTDTTEGRTGLAPQGPAVSALGDVFWEVETSFVWETTEAFAEVAWLVQLDRGVAGRQKSADRP